MRLPHIKPVLEILEENRLESWNFNDFSLEIERSDSIALVTHYETIVTGFCIARLITKLNLGDYESSGGFNQ